MKTGDTYKDIAEYIENAKLFYMDTDNFTIHVKTDDTYKDLAEDVVKRRLQLISNMLKEIQRKKKIKTGLCENTTEKSRRTFLLRKQPNLTCSCKKKRS